MCGWVGGGVKGDGPGCGLLGGRKCLATMRQGPRVRALPPLQKKRRRNRRGGVGRRRRVVVVVGTGAGWDYIFSFWEGWGRRRRRKKKRGSRSSACCCIWRDVQSLLWWWWWPGPGERGGGGGEGLLLLLQQATASWWGGWVWRGLAGRFLAGGRGLRGPRHRVRLLLLLLLAALGVACVCVWRRGWVGVVRLISIEGKRPRARGGSAALQTGP